MTIAATKAVKRILKEGMSRWRFFNERACHGTVSESENFKIDFYMVPGFNDQLRIHGDAQATRKSEFSEIKHNWRGGIDERCLEKIAIGP
jgi:hypothetical protein